MSGISAFTLWYCEKKGLVRVIARKLLIKFENGYVKPMADVVSSKRFRHAVLLKIGFLKMPLDKSYVRQLDQGEIVLCP